MSTKFYEWFIVADISATKAPFVTHAILWTTLTVELPSWKDVRERGGSV